MQLQVFQNRQKKMKLLFNLVSLAIILTLVIFLIYFTSNSEQYYTQSIKQLFDKIPIFGNVIYLYVRINRIIDFIILYNKLYLPVIYTELIYMTLSLMLCQLIIFIFHHRLLTKNNAFISSIIIFVILLTMIMNQNMLISIVKYVFADGYKTKLMIIDTLIIIQMIIILIEIYYLSKTGHYEINKLFTQKTSYQTIKLGVLLSITYMVVVIFTMNYIKDVTRNIRLDYRLDHVIDLTERANDAISIEIPPKTNAILNTIGIQIPKTITGGQILKRYQLNTIEIGEMINLAVAEKLDEYEFRYIIVPMIKVSIGILVSILIITMSFITYKKDDYQKLLSYVIVALSLLLFIKFSQEYTGLLYGFTALILVGSVIHLGSNLNQ